ncbi:alpha-ketoglutarate-dependent dioxygenase AlkB [Rhodoplanes sp. Z2-YC6860]|uniref:alpha-ketoglutarate-dependent dioxygenase AlkB n=1 Tax=Rhodoplanes sp. Z2-YC6860 TaxID=674703 RepID=UPI00078D9DB0|nr:alpha-ketoglutarate-dependent dioxygenase AlkB [Rhodoplanes sp. Z2-YC6860]AMN44980.1 alkylated DNA repair protein [Rhodoplanes sp. Z2-YC6860]
MNIRAQPDLFAATPDWPQGFRYESGVTPAEEQQDLVEQFQTLPFKEFEFQGFLGKRRVVSFGWRYDFNNGGFQKTCSIPDFMLPLRDRAARFAGLDGDALAHALVLEYPPGAAIGWHKDRPMFDDVIGISFASPCTFRFRRKSGQKWERRSLTAEPGSMYLLRGPSRTEWEHSIPGVDALRYSVTFRSLAR